MMTEQRKLSPDGLAIERKTELWPLLQDEPELLLLGGGWLAAYLAFLSL
jgi:hypothetical protein